MAFRRHHGSKAEPRTIMLNYPGDTNRVFFDPNARDNCTEPFILLRDHCRKLGFSVEAAGRQSLQDCAWLLFWDAPSFASGAGFKGFLRRLRFGVNGGTRNWLNEVRNAGKMERLVLFLWEPPSVCPENWKIDFYSQFSTVFTWNDDLVDGIRVHKFCYPVPVHVLRVEPVVFSKKKLLVNISMNKFSDYPNELYSARREAIRYFEKHRPDDFDLYGVGWERPGLGKGSERRSLRSASISIPYRSYRGTVTHKWEVLPKYRFALCYENVSDQPGWITEKVFDCMRADCVPIYWGAPNVTDYVDPTAFIDRRKFSSNQELEDYVCGIGERDYQRFRESIADYLVSQKFKAFLSPAFVENIVHVLGLDHAGLGL